MLSRPRGAVIIHTSTRALLCLLTLVSAARGADVGLTPLGGFTTGAVFSKANAVSADGSTVVGVSATGLPGASTKAFRWTAATGMVSLGDIPGFNFPSEAWGVSADGSMIVGTFFTGTSRAFRWTSATGMVNMSGPPGGFIAAAAYDVSGDGSIIVGTGGGAGGPEAFRWTSSTGTVGLGDLDGVPYNSAARGISTDGSVIVGETTANGSAAPLAFRYSAGSGMTSIGDLPGGVPTGYAFDANDDGSVIVGQSFGENGFEAYRWTSAGGMIGLNPDGDDDISSSAAGGVSGDGSIVVGGMRIGGTDEAFYWSPAAGMTRLWDVLLSAGVNPAADGWTNLRDARGISADGTTVVGYGIRNGNTEAFIAVVPEPNAIALALLGLGAIAFKRTRPQRRAMFARRTDPPAPAA